MDNLLKHVHLCTRHYSDLFLHRIPRLVYENIDRDETRISIRPSDELLEVTIGPRTTLWLHSVPHEEFHVIQLP